MSTPQGYRLLDELADATQLKRKLPWSPVGIFVLTIIFSPLGALLFGINWARLNRPEKRPTLFTVAFFALAVPILASLCAYWFKLDLNRVYWRQAMSFFSIAIAYWQLLEQRPAFDIYVTHGGKAASSRTLWLCGLLMVVIAVSAVFLKNGL